MFIWNWKIILNPIYSIYFICYQEFQSAISTWIRWKIDFKNHFFLFYLAKQTSLRKTLNFFFKK
jgi:hypothetical protein